ncbi:putative cytochrome p450 [Rhypophila sp. PSN 637]
MTFETITTLALFLLAGYIARCLKSWHRLAHIPGPTLASHSSLCLLCTLLSGKFHEHMRFISHEYGPLVRIGPNDLLCTDPEALRRICAARSPYTKGKFYQTGRVIPGHDNIVTLRDETKHKALRVKLGAAYAGRESGGCSGLEGDVNSQVKQFLRLIEDKYLSKDDELRPLELTSKAMFFTLDVISEMSFGGAFGFLKEDKDLYQFIEINDSAMPVMNFLLAVPWLTNFVYRWPLKLALPSDGDHVGLGRLMGLAKGYVDDRLRKDAKPGSDMLQAFIKSGMDYDELVQHMFVQIVAGSVTTAAAIRHTLLALICSPSSYMALRKEIDEAVAEGRISATEVITNPEAQSLPYLQAVIKEGLRMWPPATGLGSKQVPKGGDEICGYFVPEGTQIAHNFSGIMCLEVVFGKDAKVFRPERWLGNSSRGQDDRLQVMNMVVDLAFSHGKYLCLGKKIALLELNKIFVELLRRYDFSLVDPHNPIKSKSGVFWLASDLWLRVSRRQHSAHELLMAPSP